MSSVAPFDRVEFFDESGWLVGQGPAEVKEGFSHPDGTPWLTSVSSVIPSGSVVVRADLVGPTLRGRCWNGHEIFLCAGTLTLDIIPDVVRGIIDQTRAAGEAPKA